MEDVALLARPRAITVVFHAVLRRDGLETETSRSRDVSRRIQGLVSKYLLSSRSRLGLGRLGLAPMSYFPLSRKEKHVND
jgi:hypothetical protein